MLNNLNGVEFKYNDDSCTELVATYTSQEEPTPITASLIRSTLLKNNHFGYLNFNNTTLEKFVSTVNQNLSTEDIIATTTPIQFITYVSEDWQRAIAIIPKKEGVQVTNTNIPIQQLKTFLTKDKIIHGIFETLPIPVEKDEHYYIPIAKATLPSPPPETYQLLFHQPDKPIKIEANSKLMQHIKGVCDEIGTDIFGNELSQEHLNESPFNNSLNGSKESKADSNLLISTISGHPVVHVDGVEMTEVRTIKQVTLLHSPCEFQGTLYIKEDVESGVEINVKGDVIIDGMVGAASITASGNIIVKSGVMGGVIKDGDENLKKGAMLFANGVIKAKYIDNAKVNANSHLLVEEYISSSHVICHKKILIGSKNGKGQIIGGDTHTSLGLVANIIGSNSHIKTEINIGMPKDISIEIIENDAELYNLDYDNFNIKRKLGQLKLTLESTIDKNKQLSINDKILSFEMKYKENLSKIRKLKHINQMLRKEQTDYKKACIIGKSKIFGNTSIKFRDSKIHIEQDQDGATFKIDGEELKKFNR